MGAAFPHVTRDPVQRHEHAADRQPAPRRRAGGCCAAARRDCRADLRPLALADARAARRRRCAAASVYTDDKAPVEWLVDKSIVDYAAGE